MNVPFRPEALQYEGEDSFPKELAFNSFSQAKKNIERLYNDYE